MSTEFNVTHRGAGYFRDRLVLKLSTFSEPSADRLAKEEAKKTRYDQPKPQKK